MTNEFDGPVCDGDCCGEYKRLLILDDGRFLCEDCLAELEVDSGSNL